MTRQDPVPAGKYCLVSINTKPGYPPGFIFFAVMSEINIALTWLCYLYYMLGLFISKLMSWVNNQIQRYKYFSFSQHCNITGVEHFSDPFASVIFIRFCFIIISLQGSHGATRLRVRPLYRLRF